MSNAGLNCGLHKGDNISSEVAVSLSSWKYQSNNMLYLMVHLPQCAHFIQGKSHAGSLTSIEEHLPWHKGGFKALLVQCSSRLWQACRSRTANRSVSRITQTLFPELVYFLHTEGMQSNFKSPLCERGPKGELLRVCTSAEIQLLPLCLTSLWVPAGALLGALSACPAGRVCKRRERFPAGLCSSVIHQDTGYYLALLRNEDLLFPLPVEVCILPTDTPGLGSQSLPFEISRGLFLKLWSSCFIAAAQ